MAAAEPRTISAISRPRIACVEAGRPIGAVQNRTVLTSGHSPPASTRLHVRVEDPHQLPVRLVFLDELLMRRGILVGVVGGLRVEDDVQGDVEVAVVDRAGQLVVERAAGEEERRRGGPAGTSCRRRPASGSRPRSCRAGRRRRCAPAWHGLVRRGEDRLRFATDRLRGSSPTFDRPDDALLGDDAGDQLGRGDVEGGVVDVDAVGGGLAAEAVGDLARVALLDRDGRAVGESTGRRCSTARRRRTGCRGPWPAGRRRRCRSCWPCRRWRRSGRRRRRPSGPCPPSSPGRPCCRRSG